MGIIKIAFFLVCYSVASTMFGLAKGESLLENALCSFVLQMWYDREKDFQEKVENWLFWVKLLG